ncbi:hypothetical protein Vadar_018672 [Vaccinium darrowii]|uniref:Uncharacterized protein n=1 Tax=Vaccinium darrowii TaxID=229202 RepID=A0ACB7YWL3_9ERIC|nr:hypothetical protein Vadar_018672 [Vaccinium darrowii]
MEGVTQQATSGWMQFWATWDLRLAILFSLFLQIFLIFSAPLRKRTSKGYVLVPMWFAYLLADATAIYAAGLVIKGQGDTHGPFANPGLVAFWAPFLLVHLGGPDSITAFALEDNELWLRHLLGLGFPCWAVVYSMFQSFPTTSSGGLKDSVLQKRDPGPVYAKHMDESTRNPMIKQMLPKSTRREKRPNQNESADLSDLDVLQLASKHLMVYLLPLISDLRLGSNNRRERRDFFLERTARDAFKLVEVEFNFLYDMLYTKAVVVHNYYMHPRLKRWETIIGIFGLTNKLDAMKYVKKMEFTNDLRDFIFEELKLKSGVAKDLETAKKIYSSRGDWTLSENQPDFLRWTSKVEFDKSLLLWHIATELCFNTDDSRACTSHESANATNPNNNSIKLRSKVLSDYMFYLLMVESSMIPTLIGIGQIRFIDTCAEAKVILQNESCQNTFTLGKCCFHKKCCCKGEKVKACERILAIDPNTSCGNSSKSVLFSASKLAKELKKIPSEEMLKLISKVWVELLSYAACHCRPRTHAAQLGKGGQLITLVWLLMAHLGLGNQFLISDTMAEADLDMEECEVHPRAELDMEE